MITVAKTKEEKCKLFRLAAKELDSLHYAAPEVYKEREAVALERILFLMESFLGVKAVTATPPEKVQRRCPHCGAMNYVVATETQCDHCKGDLEL